MWHKSRLHAVAALTALIGVAAVGAISGSVSNALASTPSSQSVSFALPPGLHPTYIFPLSTAANAEAQVNYEYFQFRLYPPLYWFGLNGKPLFNPSLSLAYAPTYSDGGRTVTIRLKPYHWSDGVPISSRDVELCNNLMSAERDVDVFAVAGEYPSNVTNFKIISPTVFQMTFNKAYNHQWLLYNELSQLTPMPQHAWDKESAGGPVGNYDLTPAGAAKVYDFLNSQSNDLSTYATNPLWKVVSGAWLIHAYSPATGYTVLTPNQHYSVGPVPRIKALDLVPFTSDAAEYDALRDGQLTYGYVPEQDLGQTSYLRSRGYDISPWNTWTVNYMPLNFTNPVTGPIFDQLYIRQAMQRLIDQPEWIKDILKGYGTPMYGPVPLTPKSPFVSPEQSHNPYPYSTAAARSLLTAHGWKVRPSGVTTCAKPGSGSDECGAGIKAGAELSFTMLYATGSTILTEEMQALESSFSQVGIKLLLKQAPFGTIFADFVPCTQSNAGSCDWDMINWGDGWTYSPNYYPNGDELFESTAAANGGGYDSATNDANIIASTLEPGVQPLYRYENYMAKNLGVLWVPWQAYQISAVSNKLGGTEPQDPTQNIYPQNWYWKQ